MKAPTQPADGHQVVVTSNTEYHLHGDCCIGVRDRSNKTWLAQHGAVGSRLVGSFSPQRGLQLSISELREGDRMCFSNDVLTSPVTQVRQPGEATLAQYRPPA